MVLENILGEKFIIRCKTIHPWESRIRILSSLRIVFYTVSSTLLLLSFTHPKKSENFLRVSDRIDDWHQRVQPSLTSTFGKLFECHYWCPQLFTRYNLTNQLTITSQWNRPYEYFTLRQVLAVSSVKHKVHSSQFQMLQLSSLHLVVLSKQDNNVSSWSPCDMFTLKLSAMYWVLFCAKGMPIHTQVIKNIKYCHCTLGFFAQRKYPRLVDSIDLLKSNIIPYQWNSNSVFKKLALVNMTDKY